MTSQFFLTVCSLTVALIVAMVAVQQYVLSKQKFKLELFKKRYGIYEAVQVFLNNVITKMDFTNDDYFEFKSKTRDSVFLFHDDIPEYIKQISSKALEFRSNYEKSQKYLKENERLARIKKDEELLNWITEQITESINKFKPYLEFKKWK